MDWSATLSLTTSRAKQHRANYGSFVPALTRHGSASTISIPQSIPEHQCVVQFASPRLPHAHYEMDDAAKLGYGSHAATVTITETSNRASGNTFKMLLTSSSHGGSRSSSARIDDAQMTARAAGDDPADPHTSSYWIQERERMRLKREGRHRLGKNGSPTKRSPLLGGSEEPNAPAWRTAAIMCSVPLVLITAFAIFVLLFGDGTDGSSAPFAPHAIAASSMRLASAATGNDPTQHHHLRSPSDAVMSRSSVVDPQPLQSV